MLKYFIKLSPLTVVVLIVILFSACIDGGGVAAAESPEIVLAQRTTPSPTMTPSPMPTATQTPLHTPDPTPSLTPAATQTHPAPTYAPTFRPTRKPWGFAPTPEPTPTPTPKEVALIDLPHSSVGNSAWFVTSGTPQNNAIWLNPRGTEQFSGTLSNHVTYWLGMHAVSFRAAFAPPPDSPSREITMVYRVHGLFPDRTSRLLYTSPLMTSASALIPIDINVRGAEYMQIELEVHFDNEPVQGFQEHGFPGGYRGIENAVILTTLGL